MEDNKAAVVICQSFTNHESIKAIKEITEKIQKQPPEMFYKKRCS